MKECYQCKKSIDDDARFCNYCGAPQPEIQTAVNQATAQTPAASEKAENSVAVTSAAKEESQMAASTTAPQQAAAPTQKQAPVQAQQAAAPMQKQAPVQAQPQQPRPHVPSEFEKDAARFFPWLFKFGSDENMNIWWTLIPLFTISLFTALAVAPATKWHAGYFFLNWLTIIVFGGALFFAGFGAERLILQNDTPLKLFYHRFASRQMPVLVLSFVTFILGAISYASLFVQSFIMFFLVVYLWTVIAALDLSGKSNVRVMATIVSLIFVGSLLMFLQNSIIAASTVSVVRNGMNAGVDTARDIIDGFFGGFGH